jgi:hypothetical protein
MILNFMLCCPSHSDEQATIDQVDTDFGIWPMFDINFPIYKDKVSGYFFVLPLLINNARDVNPLQLRTALIFNPKKNLTLWSGYDRSANLSQKINFNENRFWQQVGYTYNFKRLDRLSVKQRLRVEERLIENSDTSIRIRYRVGANFDIGEKRLWYLIAQNEILLNANKTIGREAGFSENRTFVGVGRRITPNFSVEVGYQPALINSAGQRNDILRHYFLTYVTIKIPYKSPKAKTPNKESKAKVVSEVINANTVFIDRPEVPIKQEVTLIEDTQLTPISLKDSSIVANSL